MSGDLCAEHPEQPYHNDICAEDPDGQRMERFPDGQLLTLWAAEWANNRRQRRVTLHDGKGNPVYVIEAGELYAKRYFEAERTRIENEQT